MSHTLKLHGDLSLPGLALPEAFETLDNRLESVMQLPATIGAAPDAQVVGLITVCEEMKHLLKCTFIENGMLASRIEILTRYQMESVKKMEKKVMGVDVENKVTRKHMKRLRKKLNQQLSMQRKNNSHWWDVNVRTSDYDSFITLSRAGGYPDLEFMLRVNQLMIDFVGDANQTELVLPPMGLEERQEVSKLASIYKLRCRYGKSVQLAPSTLLKARQASVPAAGEVDAILNNFARSHNQRKANEEVIVESDSTPTTAKELMTSGAVGNNSKEERQKPPSISLPSTMLTPISNLPSPTVDISSLKNPSHSPPSSTLPTPTASSSSVFSRSVKQSREGHGSTAGGATSGTTSTSSSSSTLSDRKTSVATQSGSLASPSLSSNTQKPHPPTSPFHSQPHDAKRTGVTGTTVKGSSAVHATKELTHPLLGSTDQKRPVPPTIPSVPVVPGPSSSKLLPAQSSSYIQPPALPAVSSGQHQAPLSPVGIVLTPSSAGGTRPPCGGVLVQSHTRTPSTHSTVLALPISSPTLVGVETSRGQRKEKEGNGKKRVGGSGETEAEEGSAGESLGAGGGGGSARTDSLGPPMKRVRVTRRSAAEEELAKQ